MLRLLQVRARKKWFSIIFGKYYIFRCIRANNSFRFIFELKQNKIANDTTLV